MTTPNTMKALSKRTRIALIFAILLPLIGCDQATKYIAKETLADGPGHSFLGDLFRLNYAENKGAFLGLGSRVAETPRQWFYRALTVGLIVGLAALIRGAERVTLFELVAYSLIIAGGLGNAIDRMHLEYVIDFMNMGILNLRTGIFNVADVAIMAGTISLLVYYLFIRDDKKTASGASV